MKPKKLFRKISEEVGKSNFTKEDYKMRKKVFETVFEIETHYFTNSYSDVYIHRYHNSVRFYIQDKITKEDCMFEIWDDEYRVDRIFKKSNITNFFDTIFEKTIGYINL